VGERGADGPQAAHRAADERRGGEALGVEDLSDEAAGEREHEDAAVVEGRGGFAARAWARRRSPAAWGAGADILRPADMYVT